MRVTLKDIAKETNLSVTTVSLVLNKKDCRVSDSTRSLILETAEKMHYYPNQLAVGLVKQETKTIGLIIPDISNHFFANLALGIDDEMLKHDRNIILSNTSDRPERDLKSIQVLRSRGVDAIILAMASNIDRTYIPSYKDLINDSPIPIITVDRCNPALNCSALKLNNKKGAYNAVSHLLSLGHKNIVCITGPANSDSTQERLAGYEWAYRDAGIPLPKKYVFHGDYLRHSGNEATKQILKETDATAVFAFNDLMALGAYHCLRQEGLSVPDDISIVGFDNIDFSDMLEVPLTTVNQPTYEIGREAAKRALLEISGPEAEKQTISFEPHLIIRKSTAKPR